MVLRFFGSLAARRAAVHGARSEALDTVESLEARPAPKAAGKKAARGDARLERAADQVADDAAAAAADVKVAAREASTDVSDAAKSAAADVSEAAESAAGSVADAAETLASGVSEAAGDAADVADALAADAADAADALASDAGDVAESVQVAVEDASQRAGRAADALASDAAEAVDALAGDAAELAGDVGEAVAEAGEAAALGAQEAAAQAADAAASVQQAVLTAASQAAGEAAEAVGSLEAGLKSVQRQAAQAARPKPAPSSPLPPPLPPVPADAAAREALVAETKQQLVGVLASLDRGAAATVDQAERVDRLAGQLERLGGPVSLAYDPAATDGKSGLSLLDGRWRLLYSSGFGSGSLGGRRPGPSLGGGPFTLGQVYQDIDTGRSELNNVVDLFLRYSLAAVPALNIATPTANAVLKHRLRVVGAATVEITYTETEVKLAGGLGGWLDALPQFTLPGLPEALQPPESMRSARFEVVYLDRDLRITRGDRDELRVFLKGEA